jgi:cation transport protein ChaC
MSDFARPDPSPDSDRHSASRPREGRIQADWVFAYGSLIWNPGFEFSEAALARVNGYHRFFCIQSMSYRGTPEQPGVVLGLDRGGACIGMAFRLKSGSQQDAIDSLYEREMGGGVYVPRVVTVTVQGNRREQALAFIANQCSPAYARLSETEILRRLSSCRGQRGPNREYALRTWQSLSERGVHCPHLSRLGPLLLAAEASEATQTGPSMALG